MMMIMVVVRVSTGVSVEKKTFHVRLNHGFLFERPRAQTFCLGFMEKVIITAR